MTRHRFSEIDLAGEICLFDTAYCYPIVIVHPCAGAILNERGFPFLVFFFPHIFALLQFGYAFRHQKGFYVLVYFVEYLQFSLIKRRTCIALDTAGTFAGMQIAYEVFFKQVFADYFILDRYQYSTMDLYFWEMVPVTFSKISISARSLLVCLCLLMSLTVSFSASAQYQSLCWRISGNGLKAPSYIYGTMHVSDKRVFNFGDKANKAFAESKAYAMELDPEKAMSMGTLTKMIMTDGNKISKLIPDSDYQFLDSIVKITSGFGMALFNSMEPIIVSAILDEYGMGMTSSDTSNMDQEMDMYFYKKAKKDKKKVIGIETVDEQIGALHSLNYKEQADLLIQSIQDIKKGAQSSDADLMKYYLAQNLDSLYAMSDDQQMPPKLYKAMITDRNINMADRIAVFIHKQSTFIGVGAMHLPGDGGVIALLRKKGYTVEAWR